MADGDLRSRLAAMLNEIDAGFEEMRTGGFRVEVNSTAVFVTVHDASSFETPADVFTDGPAEVVTITSPVLRSVPVTNDLLSWVATEGWRFLFGHVTLEETDGLGDLNFQHRLLATRLDAEELDAAVVAVVATADQLDDELQARFGGERFID